ncbi:hemoglobin [Salegentibacter echinorum]|uniref:Hemoglobin n=1 Tax=Salegentibacter echinorum TaxID=1073325 RepID=A0A1M5JKH2_SALEC|nr:group III truncated hemoglobin [Salegentibacter echinorum]SHG40905.1 hemoglobin [Salegentibacter echinorum]
MSKEILSLDDVKLLVDSFYGKVQEDKLLKDVFNNVIEDRWPEHLEKMYTFWQTVLLGEHTYYGAPFVPHAKLPVDKKHFDRWLELFYKTLDEHFEGEKAEEAKWRATKMAQMFQLKIEHFQQTNTKPLI